MNSISLEMVTVTIVLHWADQFIRLYFDFDKLVIRYWFQINFLNTIYNKSPFIDVSFLYILSNILFVK